MSASERFGPMAGPFGNVIEVCAGNLDAMAKRLEPLAVGAGKCNLEVFGLMTRRARAWLELPSRLGQCGTPQDLFDAQLQFWRTAVQDYADGAERVTLALRALAAPGPDGVWGGNASTPARDYLAVAGAKAGAAEAAKRDRRAA